MPRTLTDLKTLGVVEAKLRETWTPVLVAKLDRTARCTTGRSARLSEEEAESVAGVVGSRRGWVVWRGAQVVLHADRVFSL